MMKKVRMTLFAPVNDAIQLPNEVMPGHSANYESIIDELELKGIGKEVGSVKGRDVK